MATRTLMLAGKIEGASPQRVYDLFMNPELHGAFTKSKCEISDKVGTEFTLGDGWIVGKNLELAKGKKIVQLWRGKYKNGEPWPDNVWSKATFELVPRGEDTEVFLTQADVPADVATDLTTGWTKYYFEPMNEYVKANPEKKGSKAGTKRASEAEEQQAQKKGKHEAAEGNSEDWEKEMRLASICHIDIPVKDMERAKKFYKEAFGWEFEDTFPGYTLFRYKGMKPHTMEKGTVTGGLYVSKDEFPKSNHINLHLWMPTIEEGVKNVKKAGGVVTKERFEIGPGIGFNAFVKDTEGNIIGIYSKH